VDVIVAAADLPAGTVIAPEHLRLRRLPDVYVATPQLLSGAPVIGRRLAEPTFAGEGLRPERFAAGPDGGPFPGSPAEARLVSAGAGEDTVMVIVAARDLAPGARISEEDLYAIAIPPEYLPNRVFLSPEYVVGSQVCGGRILANEMVRTERVCP
jgi:Flp pilus assembly protein CpaB